MDYLFSSACSNLILRRLPSHTPAPLNLKILVPLRLKSRAHDNDRVALRQPPK
jgi:hypothetical protein